MSIRNSQRSLYKDLFTCATSCTIHLEVVTELSVENFVLACHAKIDSPKIGPAGLILAEKPAKTGPPDYFC